MSGSEEFNDEEMGDSQTTVNDHDDDNDDDDVDETDKKARELIPYLHIRACHLPGHGWWKDWYQHVIANNHVVFGLFLAYRYHPVTMIERILVFFASVAASLVISEGFYLIWLMKEDGYVSKDPDTDFSSSYRGYKIAVYTIGAFIHTSFDLFIYAIAGCSCVEPEGFFDRLNRKTKTSPLVIFGIFASTTTLAILLTLQFETIDNGKKGMEKDEAANYTMSILEDGFSGINLEVALSGVGSYEENKKWLEWFKHLVMYYLLYDISFSTLFFSGILGFCPKVPVLGFLFGGRPLEIKLEEEEAAKKKKKKKKGDKKKGDKKKVDKKKKKKKRKKEKRKSIESLDYSEVETVYSE